ncbi:MAG: S1 RNA-binding domain-containing protein [Streptococcaceae bacterium]|jgi:general stress protein 13|nr:S1 RNA-binding domain-containing protein [Streptococcaceae bacterium]
MVKIGDILIGTVTGLQPYGAFVQLDSHTQGLIHVSEMKAGFVKNIHDVLKINQKIRVQVIDIDEFSKKISLSIRILNQNSEVQTKGWKRYFTNRNQRIGFVTLRHALPKWIKEDLAYLKNCQDKTK